MSNYAIEVENLGKRYILGAAENATAGQPWWRRAMAAPYSRYQHLRGNVPEAQQFWALRDINFKLEPGEVLGVVGHNGAGKSSLLKLLSRITSPTEGHMTVNGRISSLLEVGTGFQPELTGRENVYLNAAILGMSRQEVNRKFDEIVAFAEVEKFIDTPVKRYSSGMQVRLAFAVAAHLEPEVMVIDEVLAVGDVAFQQRCLGKIGEVSRDSARTVLFVSHNMTAVKQLCSRAILLDHGRMVEDGLPDDIISHYLGGLRHQGEMEAGRWVADNALALDGTMQLLEVRIEGAEQTVRDQYMSYDDVSIVVDYEVLQPLQRMRLVVVLRDATDVIAFTNFEESGVTDWSERQPGCYRASFTIPGDLLNQGDYFVDVGADVPNVRFLLHNRATTHFSVVQGACGVSDERRPDGVFRPKLPWTLERFN